MKMYLENAHIIFRLRTQWGKTTGLVGLRGFLIYIWDMRT